MKLRQLMKVMLIAGLVEFNIYYLNVCVHICHAGCLGVLKHLPDPQELLLQVLVKSQMRVATELRCSGGATWARKQNHVPSPA